MSRSFGRDLKLIFLTIRTAYYRIGSIRISSRERLVAEPEMTNNFIPFHRPSIGEEEIDEVAETLRSGWLTTGPRAARFEREFGEYVGAPYAVAVNSCTAALHLALAGLGIGAGRRSDHHADDILRHGTGHSPCRS